MSLWLRVQPVLPFSIFCRECVEAMLSNFALVAGQVVTLFLLMGVGFVLAQLGKLYPDGVSQI